MTSVCAHVDLALSLQRTIRDPGGLDDGLRSDGICGRASVGSVDGVDGARRHFCALHRLVAPIVRDGPPV